MQGWNVRGAKISTSLMFVLVMVALVISPVLAQDEEAALEPVRVEWAAGESEPIQDVIALAVAAIERENGLDLSAVRSYAWDTTGLAGDWDAANAEHPSRIRGIDSCVSTELRGRDIFRGATVTITTRGGQTFTARVSRSNQAVAICDLGVTAAAGGANAAVDPNLPPPVAGAGATGAFELGGHVDGLTGPALSALQQSGMTWIKKQLPTSAGVAKGVEFINAAKSNGYKILLGVVGDRAALGADPEGYASGYATFVRALAEAGADAIEIWNEPNIDREWPAGQINGANYTRLLAASYNAIKGVNPNTIVISGAPAPTGFFGAAGCAEGGCNDDTFMQQMAAAGAANYLDCVGLHYNEGIVPPSQASGDPRGEYPTYYFNSMTSRGASLFPGKPICYTELGYLSGEDQPSAIPGGFAWAQNVTVAEHAAWLADAAARAAARGDVRLMIVWNVNFTRWDSDPMGGYAIIRPDGSCPACSALGTVMRR